MSESFTIQGKVKLIEETQEFSSGFLKREFVVTMDGDTDYPQDIKFEILKDKVTLLDRLSIGQEVSVTFNLKGNEWKGKYYVNLTAWQLDIGEGYQPSERPGTALDQQDDIPFSPVI